MVFEEESSDGHAIFDILFQRQSRADALPGQS